MQPCPQREWQAASAGSTHLGCWPRRCFWLIEMRFAAFRTCCRKDGRSGAGVESAIWSFIVSYGGIVSVPVRSLLEEARSKREGTPPHPSFLKIPCIAIGRDSCCSESSQAKGRAQWASRLRLPVRTYAESTGQFERPGEAGSWVAETLQASQHLLI